MIERKRHPVAAVCRVLNVSRSNIAARHGPVNDPQVLEQLREVASRRPTYGYRRLWVMLNRCQESKECRQ